MWKCRARVRRGVYRARGTVMAVTFAFVPQEIPVELCSSVGAPPNTPIGECLNQVIIDVGDDGVAAPKGEDIAGLRQVVADSKQKGTDLKIVVLPVSPRIEAHLRDVAWEVGHAYPGSTVLVLSPGMAGTYSQQYDRVTLENGQDVAKLPGGFVHSARSFADELQKPEFPWSVLTIALVLVVAVGVVMARVLQVRGRRAAAKSEESDPSPSVASE
ncbi:MAG: hypothetical protein QOH60_5254 [Mycobacterium sp.]|jgi:hypothetical protein|nr:hypothetical protein [Mycobacterium sp.]